MNRLPILIAGLGMNLLAPPVLAQQALTPAEGELPAEGVDYLAEDEAEDIIVTGGRPAGSVLGNIEPELSLSPGDIRSYGVSTVSDLIAELSPQTASGQGRGGEAPIVLLSGKRISGFSEIRSIPTEAIQRVEILPEEVALKYGYRPSQKVVNIVLRRRFNAVTAELEGSGPTEGGQFSQEVEASYLNISEAGRLNIALEYERSSALFESERDIIPQLPRQPYDLVGNIASAVSGAEIDPALSALIDRPATVVGVPASAAGGQATLADFASETVNTSDIGQYRTLLPATDALSLNVTLARTMFGNVSTTFNGSLAYNESDSAQGLGTVGVAQQGLGIVPLRLPAGNPYSPFANDTLLYRYLGEFDPLAQRNRGIEGHLGATFNGLLGSWQWTLTGAFDRSTSRTITDRGYDLVDFQTRIDAFDPLANPFASIGIDQVTGRFTDRARSATNTGETEFVLTGSPFALPAGSVTTTVTVGGSTSDFSSRSTRSGVTAVADLSRDDIHGQLSIDLPITSARRGVLAVLGDLSVNLNAAINDYSDFGSLRTVGAGLNWKPITPLSIIMSLTSDEGAPTMQQLGNPFVSTSGVRVFDYIQGETVDIIRQTGGNPNLAADDRRVLKIGMTLKPFSASDISLVANYTDSRVNDPIASFPTATAAIEAAFPDRFTRDGNGRLIQIDSRPINFAQQSSRKLRWGFNFSKQLSTPPRPSADRPARDAPAGRDGERPEPASADRQGGGGAPGRGGFRGVGGPRGGGGTRLQLAVYHTINLKSQILVYEGGPLLDLLEGDAIGSSGGQARHEIQAQSGLTHNGLGARLSAGWKSGTTVDGGIGGAQSLRFSGLATANLRLFADLGQQRALTEKWSFLRGSRVTLSVTNLFNSRQEVREAGGGTPISYQPAYLDPLGRAVRVSFRKLFF